MNFPLRTSILALLFGLAGCQPSGIRVDYNTWRQSVETYVRDVGQGNPAVLRDVTYEDRPGFAQLGHAIPAEGTDAVGLLLGHRTIAGRPSLVYLVSLIEKETLQDVRIAILQPIPSQNGLTEFKWIIGQSNPQTVGTYLAWRKQLFKQRFPGRNDIPASYQTFPAPEDDFDLNVSAAAVTVVHRPTSITWVAKTL